MDKLVKGKTIEQIKRNSDKKLTKWKCPKCNREFSKENQSHYCGDKPKTIDEYIMGQDESIQNEERISWSMPTFWKNHNILHFAATKNHIGFYPGPEAVQHFEDQLLAYKTDKGTIRISNG